MDGSLIIDGIVIQFIAETSAARGKLRSRTRRPTGVIIAPPNPCTTRVAISVGRLSAIPHSAEPPAKISTAAQGVADRYGRVSVAPNLGSVVRRWSFNQAAGNAPAGTTVTDPCTS